MKVKSAEYLGLYHGKPLLMGCTQTHECVCAGRADIHLDPVAETDVYTQQIARLKAENATLQAQLQRAMKELKAYQLQVSCCGKFHADCCELLWRQQSLLQYPSAVLPDESTADEGILPPWVLSPEAMNPLLQAYDTRKSSTHVMTALLRRWKKCEVAARGLGFCVHRDSGVDTHR